jgi:hypothetical protein
MPTTKKATMKNRLKRLLQRKKRTTTPPPRPENYPSLPIRINVLTPTIKSAVTTYLREKLNELYAKVGSLTGKQQYMNSQGKKSTKKVPINSFAKEFSIGRMSWQNRVTKMEKEIKYIEWQLQQWQNAPLRNTPQFLPHVPEKVFRKLTTNKKTTSTNMIVMPQQNNTKSSGPFKDTMTMNEIRKLYKKLLLQHHPNKGGSKNMFTKITSQYQYTITKRSINELYNEGIKLLTSTPSTQAERNGILNTVTSIVLSGRLLSDQERIPAQQFESLRLRQLSFARQYDLPIRSRHQRLKTILKQIDTLHKGKKWTVKSVLQDLIGLKRNNRIPSLLKRIETLDKIIRSVQKITPGFILQHNGQEILIDQTYINALLADLMAMKLTTTAALEDARKALKRKTNKNLEAFYKSSKLAQNEMIQWFKQDTAATSSKNHYKKLLLTSAPLQYIIQSLPAASGLSINTPSPPPPQQQPSILNQAYLSTVGMVSFVAIGLLHRIQRRVQQ